MFFCRVLLRIRRANAATIARWTFETNPPTTAGPISANEGTGTGTAVHATPISFSNPSGNGSAESWNSNSWTVGDYYQFQVSTLGMRDLIFSWDQTRAVCGPGNASPSSPNFRLQYSTDGTTFTDVVDYVVPSLRGTTPLRASQRVLSEFEFDYRPRQSTKCVFRLTAILPPQNSVVKAEWITYS